MLFNSWLFIFAFLPVVLIGYFVLGRRSNLAAVVWLALASLAFYSFSNWQFVLLLLASIAFNYGFGYLLIERKLRSLVRFAVLAVGVYPKPLGDVMNPSIQELLRHVAQSKVGA